MQQAIGERHDFAGDAGARPWIREGALAANVRVALRRRATSRATRSAGLARQVTILTTEKANEFFQPAWTGDPRPLTRDTGWQAI